MMVNSIGLMALSAGLILMSADVSAKGKETAHAKTEAMFEKAVAAPLVPGISAAVADKKGIAWARGFGYANLEHQVPMNPKHRMRIGSVAKVFATAAMMRLYDQGKVDLDKDVRGYVPAWPAKHPKITLRHLAAHTSGIRHYKGNEFMSNKAYTSVTSALDIFKDDPLKYTPGSDHSYSTYAWTLVSAATEGADGQRDFKQIMKEEVFTPLAMHDTSFDEKDTIIPNRQGSYLVNDGKLINSPQTDHSNKWAGGGFIASTADVARFAMAHLEGGYLKSSTLDAMYTKASLTDGTKIGFGIGWMVGFDRSRGRYKDNPEVLQMMEDHKGAVMHSGGSNGGVTMMILCRDHGRSVAVVKNVSGDNSADIFLLALKALDNFHKASK